MEENPFNKFSHIFSSQYDDFKVVLRQIAPGIIQQKLVRSSSFINYYESSASMNSRIAAIEKYERVKKELEELKAIIESPASSSTNKRKRESSDDEEVCIKKEKKQKL